MQMSKLVDAGMLYHSLFSSWDCDPILVPKHGPDKLSFRVDIILVNKYTVRHQLPVPKIE